MLLILSSVFCLFSKSIYDIVLSEKTILRKSEETEKEMKNNLAEKLRKQEKPLGIFIDTASSYVVECVGRTGFDFVIIDNEHSPVEAETSADLIRAAELSGLTPLVRVRENSRPAVLKVLDVGAQGIVVPNIRSSDEVRELISYCKYKPVGNRGFCPTRKDGWGYDLGLNVPDTMRYFNEQVLLIPQCETAGALDEIEIIADLDGVDGIFIGPYDLSIAMGIPGEFNNPVFQEALSRILSAVHRSGKFCILFTGTAEGVVDGFQKGYDAMTYSLDAGLLIDCFRERVRKIREQV